MTTSATALDPLAKRLKTVQHLIASGKFSEAAQRLQATAKSAPGDPRVYLVGMNLAEAAGKPDRAQEAGRRALQLAPEWPVAMTELALLLARQGQFEEAVTLAERAMAIDGDNAQVLARVIDVAQRARRLDLALAWMRRAIDVAPHTLLLRLQFAHALRLTGRRDEAIATYDAILATLPGDPPSLLGRAQTLLEMGERERALQDTTMLTQQDAANEEYAYWHQLAQGITPARQPAGMVRALFDGMVDGYDQHIVAELKYKLPRDVAASIKALYPDGKYNVLDLGCGTGLLGACLGRIEGAMIGVELSPRMIEQAARHGVYDRFHNVDLVDALRETPAALYDVVAALDVFIYVGELAGLVPDAFKVLRGGGHFVFSCEAANDAEADLVLRPTGRYAHKASHAEALCRAAGFAQVTVEPMTLRYEAMEPVAGFLVNAVKPA